MFNGLKLSASGMLSERVRLEAISSNIANANNTELVNGNIYKRKQVLLGEDNNGFNNILNGVRVTSIQEDTVTPEKLVYDPEHKNAIKEGEYKGYVRYPNVEISKEMVDLVNSQRAFELNSQTFSASKSLLEHSINIGK